MICVYGVCIMHVCIYVCIDFHIHKHITRCILMYINIVTYMQVWDACVPKYMYNTSIHPSKCPYICFRIASYMLVINNCVYVNGWICIVSMLCGMYAYVVCKCAHLRAYVYVCCICVSRLYENCAYVIYIQMNSV